MTGSITDVPGVQVGHAQDLSALTGCTVVLVEGGAVGGVDVRGGAPGTRETDLLNPVNLVGMVFAVYLGGGSAFGLDGAGGVMQYLEERNIGFETGVIRVPIVPGAVVYDLAVGSSKVRPDKEMGYLACRRASGENLEHGNVGAGTGATVGKVLGIARAMKGGLGTASVSEGELIVGALAVINAFGSVFDWQTGDLLAGPLDEDQKNCLRTEGLLQSRQCLGFPGTNTTLAVIATNAALNKSQVNKLASNAHDGLAWSIRPCHTMSDGDTVFSLSTGAVKADLTLVGTLAASAVAEAVKDAIVSARSSHGLKAYVDLRSK